MELQDSKRKRAMREDVIRARAARRIVLPINRQIAAWQADAARLRAMSARGRSQESAILAEVDRLERNVDGHIEELSAVLKASSEQELDAGRLLDTMRALRSLSGCLRQVRETLRITAGGPEGGTVNQGRPHVSPAAQGGGPAAPGPIRPPCG